MSDDLPGTDTPDSFRSSVGTALGELPPREVLAATPRRLRNVLSLYSAQDLHWHQEGRWSAAQIIHHLADSETVFAVRIKTVLLNDDPELPGYDHDAWLARIGSSAGPPSVALDRFQALREDNLSIIAGLSPEELGRSGRHVLHGRETVEDLIRIRAGHDMLHLAEVDDVLGADYMAASPLRGQPLGKDNPFALPPKQGRLITISGIDGAGKTSQALDLVDWLRSQGIRADYHKAVGIRSELDYLARQFDEPDHIALLGPDVARLLGATVRWKSMLSACARLLDPEQWLVMDRYVACEYAATRQQKASNEELIRAMYASLPVPDISFFLDISPQDAHHRIKDRDIDHEDIAFLQAFDAGYRSLPEMEDFTRIDASGTYDDVRDAMRNVVLEAFPDVLGRASG